MATKLKLSPQTMLVLDGFLDHPADWTYGYDLSRLTGLKSGTLCPILMRLAYRKLLETAWEASEPEGSGRRPQHMYRFTAAELHFARERRKSGATGIVALPALQRARA